MIALVDRAVYALSHGGHPPRTICGGRKHLDGIRERTYAHHDKKGASFARLLNERIHFRRSAITPFNYVITLDRPHVDIV